MFIYLHLFSSMFIYWIYCLLLQSLWPTRNPTRNPRLKRAIPPSDFGIDSGDFHTSLNRAVARFFSVQPFFIGEIHGEPHDCNQHCHLKSSEYIWMIWMRKFLQTLIIAIDEPWNHGIWRIPNHLYDPRHQTPPWFHQSWMVSEAWPVNLRWKANAFCVTILE